MFKKQWIEKNQAARLVTFCLTLQNLINMSACVRSWFTLAQYTLLTEYRLLHCASTRIHSFFKSGICECADCISILLPQGVTTVQEEAVHAKQPLPDTQQTLDQISRVLLQLCVQRSVEGVAAGNCCAAEL